jgi:hypothetical protein
MRLLVLVVTVTVVVVVLVVGVVAAEVEVGGWRLGNGNLSSRLGFWRLEDGSG